MSMFFPSSFRNDNRGKAYGGRGGRSKAELTAQEELAKAREDRERRKRQKLEQKSAVIIQAAWRGWSSRCATRRAARSVWIDRYGNDGEKLQAEDCLSIRAGGAVGHLLCFYRPETDWKRLASVARVVAAASKSEAFGAFVASYSAAPARPSLLHLLRALALQCLLTLSEHRCELAPLLAAARPAAPLDPSTGGSVGALMECVLLLVAPESYLPALGKPAATALAAAVLTTLAASGMCTCLQKLLVAALMPPPQAAAAPAATVGHHGHGHHGHHRHHGYHVVAAKPYIETLTTQLTVRLLALRSPAVAAAAPDGSPHMLLFVPDLWRRCGSLQPVAPRLCRAALMWLAAAGPERLAAALPRDGGGAGLPGGGGTAVAVLLANVLAVGPRLLEPPPDKTVAAVAVAAGTGTGTAAPGPQQRSLALSVARVLHAAVSLLPLQPFFPEPGTGAGGGADDSEDEVDEAACGSLGLTRLVLPPGAAAQLPAGLVEAVQGLTGAVGRQLLKQLVAVLLPCPGPPPAAAAAGGGCSGALFQRSSFPPAPYYAASSSCRGAGAIGAGAGTLQRVSAPLSAGGAASPPLSPSPSCTYAASAAAAATAQLREAAESAHALSELLWQLAQLPGQRQRVLLGAAVSCDLVERMWGTFLRAARAADLAGLDWLADADGEDGLPAGTIRPSVGSGSGRGGAWATCGASSFSSGCDVSGPVPTEVEWPPQSAAGTMAVAAAASTDGAAGSGSLGIPPVGGVRSRPHGGVGPPVTASGLDGGSGSAVVWRPRQPEDPGWLLPLAVASSSFAAQAATSTLEEFYGGGAGGGSQRPLLLRQLYDPEEPEAGFLALLRDALWQVLWSGGEMDRSPAGEALYGVLARTGGLLYGILYERNCRRAFCPTEAFHATGLAPEWFMTEANSSRSHAGREDGSTRVWRVLRYAPALVPFADRARLFQQMVAKERKEYRAPVMDPMVGALGNRFVTIRRDRLLFDGFDALNSLGEQLRGRVRVAFIDQHGAPEAGVDGGGLFKDFMEELMRSGLSPEVGLFASNSAHQLYPNPAASRVVEDASRLLAFLGRMLGKAMYENILLELPLAGFFLKKFRGAHCDLNDLPTLDPDLYRNLMRLREHFAAEAAAAAAASSSGGPATPDGSSHGSAGAAAAMDLGLTFVVADDAAAALGDPSCEVELKPGGRLIPVTPDNVNEYIHRVAHYKLNLSPRPAVSAFLSGFYELIPRNWVAMFSGEELQTLISGAEQRLDLADMQAHVAYAGGYHEEHPVIALFWEVLAGFSPEEQGKLLKFVTSCSRAPLLGFRYLEPPLCIQLSGSMLDPSAPLRLPTASTCMNLLKLPPYRTPESMRDKLLYAINAGAGFDLS